MTKILCSHNFNHANNDQFSSSINTLGLLCLGPSSQAILLVPGPCPPIIDCGGFEECDLKEGKRQFYICKTKDNYIYYCKTLQGT